MNTSDPGNTQPPSPIDTSKLFQKDPEAPKSSKKNILAKLGKKKALFLATAIVVVLVGGSVALAQFNKPEKIEVEQQAATDNTASSTPTTDSTQSTPAPEQPVASTPAPTTTTTPAKPKTSTSTGGTSSGSSGSTTVAPKTYTISYTNNCYSPANVTIKSGDTVKFVNNSSMTMEPASDNHPSHTIYSEFDSDPGVAPGGTYSFTFTKTGVWGYHDHKKSSCDGIITVQ